MEYRDYRHLGVQGAIKRAFEDMRNDLATPDRADPERRAERLNETTTAILRRFWRIPTMEGSDGHSWVRRDSVSAAIQDLPDPALTPPPAGKAVLGTTTANELEEEGK